MAGTIYKINSTNELRETFAVRMEQFGQLAIQMNDALKVQKNWRNEKDSAAKKCRLFENKVTADLRASVTDALIKKNSDNVVLIYRYFTLLRRLSGEYKGN